jgi:hypothetical protein
MPPSKPSKTPKAPASEKRPLDEEAIVSVRMLWSLINAVDAEAKAMSTEQAPGRAPIGRGELIRILVHEGLAAHAKARSERQKKD